MPTHIFLGKQIILHVPIAEKHVERAFAFVIVPDAFLVIDVPGPLPGPITLDDFVGGAARDFTCLDRRGFRGASIRGRIASDVFATEPIHRPQNQIAVAPSLKCGPRGRPI